MAWGSVASRLDAIDARSKVEGHRACAAVRARRPSKSRRADDAREAEVRDLGDAPVAQQHVRGLDVAVDDAAAVQEGKSGANIHSDAPEGFA